VHLGIDQPRQQRATRTLDHTPVRWNRHRRRLTAVIRSPSTRTSAPRGSCRSPSRARSARTASRVTITAPPHPAVADQRRHRVQRTAPRLPHRDDVRRRQAPPEPQLAAELQVYSITIRIDRFPPATRARQRTATAMFDIRSCRRR
jgi:hypothetical protein